MLSLTKSNMLGEIIIIWTGFLVEHIVHGEKIVILCSVQNRLGKLYMFISLVIWLGGWFTLSDALTFDQSHLSINKPLTNHKSVCHHFDIISIIYQSNGKTKLEIGIHKDQPITMKSLKEEEHTLNFDQMKKKKIQDWSSNFLFFRWL